MQHCTARLALTPFAFRTYLTVLNYGNDKKLGLASLFFLFIVHIILADKPWTFNFGGKPLTTT